MSREKSERHILSRDEVKPFEDNDDGYLNILQNVKN